MKYWIGERIRKARVIKGDTQATFGSYIDRCQSYISEMEHGLFDPPFHEVEILLAKAGQPLPTKREEG